MSEQDEIAVLKFKVEFVGRQVHMLVGFLLALIETHPDLNQLATQFEKTSQATIASAEPTLVAEDYVDGLLDISKRLKGAIEMALARKGSPNNPHRD